MPNLWYNTNKINRSIIPVVKINKTELENLYKNNTIKEIAEIYNIKEYKIKYLLKKYNIKNIKIRHIPYRKNYFNINYFDNITKVNQAFWLGLIAADGSIHKNQRTLSLYQTEKDSYILKQFCIDVDVCTPKFYIKKNNVVELSLSSVYLIKTLKQYNITNNKSFTVSLPKLDKILQLAYLKGLFMGDGYINNQIILSSASYTLKKDIINFCNLYYNASPKLVNNTGLRFNKDCIYFINDMFDSCKLSLCRKEDMFKRHWRINKP